jgi:hypothetical protein
MRNPFAAEEGEGNTADVTPFGTGGQQIWRALDEPRPPSADELRIISTLAAAVDEPLLQKQVQTAEVDAVCRCGCSSVRLRSDAAPIPPARVADLSARGRPDYFSAEASGTGAAGERVAVVLHVVLGRIQELEVYDTFGGAGVAVALIDITDLAEITVG